MLFGGREAGWVREVATLHSDPLGMVSLGLCGYVQVATLNHTLTIVFLALEH